MKTHKSLLIAVFGATLILAAGLNAAETGTLEYVPGELIVKLEHGILNPPTSDETPIANVPILNPQFATALQQYKVRSVERVFKSIFARSPFLFVTKRGREVQFKDLSQVYIFRMDESLDMELVAEHLEQLPGVIYAKPNYYNYLCRTPPNDVDFNLQWGLDNPVEEWDINALRAWSIKTGDSDVRLAILDSGLEEDHYDEPNDEFWGRIYREKDWTNQGIDDTIGHGTHVAGIAAAATNSGSGQGGQHGVAGVAGGWNGQGGIKLLIAKIARTRSEIPDDYILKAIEWATNQGADVINGSIAKPSLPNAPDVREALENALSADMTCFFSTGNQYPLDMYSPAAFANYDICCAVGSMTRQGTRSPTSQCGSQLSFVAPGTDIWSTYDSPLYYDSASGTSMASPHAAGVGALIYSAGGTNLWDVDCKRIMEHSARDIERYGVGWDEKTGWGCVDAWEALRHLYWPYDFEHATLYNNDLQETYMGYQDIVFTQPPKEGLPAGKYWCDVYRLSRTRGFEYSWETPWVWGRLLDVPTGYSHSNPNNAWFYVNVDNITSGSAYFETYVYYLKYDVLGRVINEWAPYDKDDIKIAYSVLGRPYTRLIQSYTNIPSNDYGQYSDLVVDPDSLQCNHISFYDAEHGDLRYRLQTMSGDWCNDLVDSDGDVGEWSSIALDGDGYPHIGYYDATNKNPKHAWKDTQGWHTEPIHPLGGGGTCTSIAVDKNTGLVQACFCLGDTSAVPYYNFMYAYRDGAPPYNWTAGVIDSTFAVVRWCSLALGPQGTPHVSYYDSLSGNLKYAVRTQGDWNTITVDSDGDVGLYTSIAVDKDGMPHISYYDATNNALKYAVGTGSGWNIETVRTVSGKWSSICIDDDGRPIIVYQMVVLADVRCAKRMSTGWHSKHIELDGTVGSYGTSVAIDNLGRVVSTYYDETNGRLRVAWLARWPPESGGSMTAGIAGVGEGLRPSFPMEPAITAVIPNPTTGSATIRYQLPYAADTRIAVYDVTGQLVTTLVWGEQQAGEHEVVWKGKDNIGREVSSGVYFVHMKTENYQSNKKLTLVR